LYREANKYFPNIAEYSQNLWNFAVFAFDYVRFRFGPKHPFQTYTSRQVNNGIYQMSSDSDIRIALAGDWANGTDVAAKIAELIEQFKPDYSIHLGDVYYVGDSVEVGENFLGIPDPELKWPAGTKATFALNGNHEMYARGTAYFERMLPALGQFASFFCLENEFWRFIALDTGYNSIGWPVIEYFWPPNSALPDELLAWLRNTVKPANDDQRGIVILSHHEYFSRFDDQFPKPAQQLAEFFSRPVLWFWGHEHRMAIYPEYALPGGIKAFGRCIGHGGMPIELPPDPPPHPECPVEFVDDRIYDENLAICFNGFAKILLQQESLSVDYVDVNGQSIFTETWTMQNGALTRIPGGPPQV
jgi:hypothetical protein